MPFGCGGSRAPPTSALAEQRLSTETPFFSLRGYAFHATSVINDKRSTMSCARAVTMGHSSQNICQRYPGYDGLYSQSQGHSSQDLNERYPGYDGLYCQSQGAVDSQTHQSSPGQPEVLGLGVVIVTFIKARGIKGDEFCIKSRQFGKADPYCELIVGKGDHITDPIITSVHKDAGSTPSWDERLAIVIRTRHEDYNHVKIVLWNKNSIRGDTQLGEVIITDLASQVANYPNKQKWHKVMLKNEQKGELQLVFNFHPMSAEDLLESDHLTESAPLRHGRYGRRTTGGLPQPTGKVQLLLAAASVAVAVATL